MRTPSQRVLLRNDLSDRSEPQIQYVSMGSKRSPLYQEHAADIQVDFSNLNINADSITLLHLQPFIHVLLGRGRSAQDQDQVVQEEAPLARSPDEPFGMRISLLFKSLDLRLFRVYSDEHKYERELDSTYSIKANMLVADISLKDLMIADVSIERFHVTDVRDESVDYIFKTIFYLSSF